MVHVTIVVSLENILMNVEKTSLISPNIKDKKTTLLVGKKR
jgi:hypothetical protein